MESSMAQGALFDEDIFDENLFAEETDFTDRTIEEEGLPTGQSGIGVNHDNRNEAEDGITDEKDLNIDVLDAINFDPLALLPNEDQIDSSSLSRREEDCGREMRLKRDSVPPLESNRSSSDFSSHKRRKTDDLRRNTTLTELWGASAAPSEESDVYNNRQNHKADETFDVTGADEYEQGEGSPPSEMTIVRYPNVPKSRLAKGSENEMFPLKMDLHALAERQLSSEEDILCGACLLELFEDTGEEAEEVSIVGLESTSEPGGYTPISGEKIGLISSCYHMFHAECIAKWAKTDNSCCQCKQRFGAMAYYDLSGRRSRFLYSKRTLQSLTRRMEMIEEANAAELASVVAGESCQICHQVGDQDSIMRCVAEGCDALAHFYCMDLEFRDTRWTCGECSAQAATVMTTAAVPAVISRTCNSRRRSHMMTTTMDSEYEGTTSNGGAARAVIRPILWRTSSRTSLSKEERIQKALAEADFDDLNDLPVPAPRLLPSEIPGASLVRKSEVADLILGKVSISELGGQLKNPRRHEPNHPLSTSMINALPQTFTTALRPTFASSSSSSLPLRSSEPAVTVRSGCNRRRSQSRPDVSAADSRASAYAATGNPISRHAALDDVLAKIASMSQSAVEELTWESSQSAIQTDESFQVEAFRAGPTEITADELEDCYSKPQPRDPSESQETNLDRVSAAAGNSCSLIPKPISSSASLTINRSFIVEASSTSGCSAMKSQTMNENDSVGTSPSSQRIAIQRKTSTLMNRPSSDLVAVIRDIVDKKFPAVFNQIRSVCSGDPMKQMRAKIAFSSRLARESIPTSLYEMAGHQQRTGNGRLRFSESPSSSPSSFWRGKSSLILSYVSSHKLLVNNQLSLHWLSRWSTEYENYQQRQRREQHRHVFQTAKS